MLIKILPPLLITLKFKLMPRNTIIRRESIITSIRRIRIRNLSQLAPLTSARMAELLMTGMSQPQLRLTMENMVLLMVSLRRLELPSQLATHSSARRAKPPISGMCQSP